MFIKLIDNQGNSFLRDLPQSFQGYLVGCYEGEGEKRKYLSPKQRAWSVWVSYYVGEKLLKRLYFFFVFAVSYLGNK